MPREVRIKLTCSCCDKWDCGKGETEYAAEIVLESQGWQVTEPILCPRHKRESERKPVWHLRSG